MLRGSTKWVLTLVGQATPQDSWPLNWVSQLTPLTRRLWRPPSTWVSWPPRASGRPEGGQLTHVEGGQLTNPLGGQLTEGVSWLEILILIFCCEIFWKLYFYPTMLTHCFDYMHVIYSLLRVICLQLPGLWLDYYNKDVIVHVLDNWVWHGRMASFQRQEIRWKRKQLRGLYVVLFGQLCVRFRQVMVFVHTNYNLGSFQNKLCGLSQDFSQKERAREAKNACDFTCLGHLKKFSLIPISD